MGPIDAVWHLANLFALPVGLAAVAAALTKLLWRKELAAVGYRQLLVPTAAACAAVVVAGLVLFGRDGKMATYGAMVAVCAATLWWRAFFRR